MIRLFVWGFLICLSGSVAGTAARADAIDGAWCLGLQRMFIEGPNITTPGGSKTTAIYDRHGIEYIVPDGEPGAGATAAMRQQHEELAHRTLSTQPEKIEPWIRCRQQVS